jgi:propionate CoA-transferase
MDLQRDILDQMAFQPQISSDLESMPEGIFREKWGGLKSIIASHYRNLPN